MNKTIEISEYVKQKHYRTSLNLPDEQVEEYIMLAQGEYNINYSFFHPISGQKLVFRLNCGSQMHLDNQIEYEAQALNLLEGTGRTPHCCYVDNGSTAPGNGVLIMKYLPGEHLDYTDNAQLSAVAACLADIHSFSVDEKNHLIRPDAPMRAILEECEEMLSHFLNSDIPNQGLKDRLRYLLDEAYKYLIYDVEPPYHCVINTELNSTNFLVEKKDEIFARLVDWEKPLYGDPAQDLGHFLAPTTTFWKTDVIFTETEIEEFIDKYIECVGNRYDTVGLKDRTMAFIPVTCLRGICWCAMAWVQYRDPNKLIVNDSTRIKLDSYLSDDYLNYIEQLVSYKEKL